MLVLFLTHDPTEFRHPGLQMGPPSDTGQSHLRTALCAFIASKRWTTPRGPTPYLFLLKTVTGCNTHHTHSLPQTIRCPTLAPTRKCLWSLRSYFAFASDPHKVYAPAVPR